SVNTYLAQGGSYSGFSVGGYTGDMGRGVVAGVVHGQEFVAHAEATRRWRPQLEAMNRGAVPMLPASGGSDRANFVEVAKSERASANAIIGALREEVGALRVEVARLTAATKQAANEQSKTK